VLWTCLTSPLSLYASTTVLISAGETVKPALVAQTLSPALLKMAALSMLPVPTRLLRREYQYCGDRWVRVRWRKRYLVSTYAASHGC
jgi:hypothetical protein